MLSTRFRLLLSKTWSRTCCINLDVRSSLGFKQVCSWLSTCFRHAFDQLATCFRHAHASRKPGLQPGLQLARIMECGLNKCSDFYFTITSVLLVADGNAKAESGAEGEGQRWTRADGHVVSGQQTACGDVEGGDRQDEGRTYGHDPAGHAYRGRDIQVCRHQQTGLCWTHRRCHCYRSVQQFLTPSRQLSSLSFLLHS